MTFEIGWRAPLHVRTEQVGTRAGSCRIAYVSDIHLRRGRSGRLAANVIAAVRRCAADLVLLGGDLVDARSEVPALTALVQQLAELSPVYAVAGNHDERLGAERVRDAVRAGGGCWIQKTVATLAHRGRQIAVGGPEVAQFPVADVRVLCAHHPRSWRRARRLGCDLVLAGHLHGCQIVAFEFRDRLFPGALFYPGNCLRRQSGNTQLVVSRGVSDLVPVRWRCPREVVLCQV